jgi:lipid-A-disaccharide synthase-like uncharacterized protein
MPGLIFKNLGLVGTIIFVSAYFPQIRHLIKVKDSTGISIFSWSLWLLGALLLLFYALYQKDFVFIALTTLETISLLLVVILSIKFRKKNFYVKHPGNSRLGA